MKLVKSYLIFLAALPSIVAASLELSAPIRRVAVVGGVHGNEYTGIWCIKTLERQEKRLLEEYDSLQISTLLGNPRAHLANKRFVDVDLNRQFNKKTLLPSSSASCSSNEKTLEVQRALEINQVLGPKFKSSGGEAAEDEEDDNGVDCIIDLHSTTANMGMTLIVPEGDVTVAQMCAYIMLQSSKSSQTKILFEGRESRMNDPFLVSCAPHGLTLEVGPVPQGVLRHDAVEHTQEALEAALEFLQRRNKQPDQVKQELQKAYPDGLVPCYHYIGKIPWPSDPQNPNFPRYLIHKSIQDRDFAPLHKGDTLFVDMDGNEIAYDGRYGSPVYLVFVNEGGYYYSSSGTGIGVAAMNLMNLETAQLVDEEEE